MLRGPMRAVVIARPGGPEVLEIREFPDPVPGIDDVVVAVRATALNRADVLQRLGRYPAPREAPADIPGLEFAGVVESCGPRVRGIGVGDRVMGLLGGGGYAEKVRVPAALCLPVPPALDWAEAAAIPEAFLTAFDALFERAAAKAGETVLVHAASSGVGTAVVQLAAVAGLHVLGTSRSAEKRPRVVALGAHECFDARDPATEESIRRSTAGRGVDVVIDLVGGATLATSLAVIAELGRIVVVGLLGGRRADLDLSILLQRRAAIIGTVLRSRPEDQRVALTREFGRRMLPQFASGRLRAIVDRVLPWEHVAQAHAELERGAHFGKIVLAVR